MVSFCLFCYFLGNLLNCSVPAVSMISSITCRPCAEKLSASCAWSITGRTVRALLLFTHIHVDRFAISILDRWVISFNEDPLDELRCFTETRWLA